MNGKKARAIRKVVKAVTGIYPKSVPEDTVKLPNGQVVYPPGTAMHCYKELKVILGPSRLEKTDEE